MVPVGFFTISKSSEKLADSSFVHQSFFGKISSDIGGAIKIDQGNVLEIVSCMFECCVSKKHGGAIWFTGNKLVHNSNCAEACFISDVKNDNFGNYIYAECSSFCEYTQTSLSLCGPCSSASSDGTSFFRKGYTQISTCNFTDCDSQWGTSGPCFECNSIVSDITLVRGFSHSTTYCSEKSTIMRAIVIGPEVQSHVFLGGTLTINDSIILIPDLTKLYYGTVQFTNCIGNISSNGISLSDTYIELNSARCYKLFVITEAAGDSRFRPLVGFMFLLSIKN